MGWKDWRSEDAETTETITQTINDMHTDENRNEGPLPGTDSE